MGPIDIIIIAAVAAAVIGIITYLIVSKRKGKNVGCGCGCASCPSAGACGGGKKPPENKPEEEGRGEKTDACPHCKTEEEKGSGESENA